MPENKPTKVYIIMTQGEDGNYISGVFINSILAGEYYEEKCMKEDKYRCHEIEEHEIIYNIQEKNGLYYISMWKDGTIKGISKGEEEDIETEKGYLEMKIEGLYNKLYMCGTFIAKTKKEAIEKANKKRLELISNNEWCYRGE